MGDTCCHLAQRGHFAGLDQLLLGLQAFGDVTGGDQQHLLPGIFGKRYADIDVKLFEVFGQMLG